MKVGWFRYDLQAVLARYGIISQIRPSYEWAFYNKVLHQSKVIQAQTPVNPGSPGSPLLNDNFLQSLTTGPIQINSVPLKASLYPISIFYVCQ